MYLSTVFYIFCGYLSIPLIGLLLVRWGILERRHRGKILGWLATYYATVLLAGSLFYFVAKNEFYVVAFIAAMFLFMVGLLSPILLVKILVFSKKAVGDNVYCRSCSYNLRGNTSGICPECGCAIKTLDNVIIQRIAFDADGQLRVYPTGRENYLYIWRAAKSVRWDDEDRSLYVLPVEDFTVVDDFNQIIKAVREEYGTILIVDETTAFDLPAEMVAQLGKVTNQTPPTAPLEISPDYLHTKGERMVDTDSQPPQQRKRRKYIYLLIPVAIVGLLLWYIFIYEPPRPLFFYSPDRYAFFKTSLRNLPAYDGRGTGAYYDGSLNLIVVIATGDKNLGRFPMPPKTVGKTILLKNTRYATELSPIENTLLVVTPDRERYFFPLSEDHRGYLFKCMYESSTTSSETYNLLDTLLEIYEYVHTGPEVDQLRELIASIRRNAE